MSYDLIIFDPDNAPNNLADFMKWNDKQEDLLAADIDQENPNITTVKLRQWFFEIIKEIIPLSGPYSNDEKEDYIEGQDDERGADYFIGQHAIYVMFSMDEIAKPTKQMLQMAKKHKVGFCDFNSSDDYIFYPKKLI